MIMHAWTLSDFNVTKWLALVYTAWYGACRMPCHPLSSSHLMLESTACVANVGIGKREINIARRTDSPVGTFSIWCDKWQRHFANVIFISQQADSVFHCRIVANDIRRCVVDRNACSGLQPRVLYTIDWQPNYGSISIVLTCPVLLFEICKSYRLNPFTADPVKALHFAIMV